MKRSVLFVVIIALLGACSAFAAPMTAGKISDHSFVVTASTDNVPYQCIAGTPCRVAMEFKNLSRQTVSLVNWQLEPAPKGVSIEAKLEPGAPTQVEPGENAMAVMMVTFPDAAGGKTIPLQCRVQYGTAVANTKIDVLVTPRFEVMMLPTRLILGPDSAPKTMGVSVINHMDKPYEEKIKFKFSDGLTVNPSEIDGKIDALGLEAYMVKLQADEKTIPGHYTLWVSADDMNLEWAMIDVPALAKKADVKNIAKSGSQIVSISNAAGKSAGTAMFAYDSKGLNILVQLTADDASSIRIGIDPLIDGAKATNGGLRSDDLIATVVAGKGYVASCTKENAGVSAMRGGNGRYFVSIPWRALAPFKLGKNKMIAASILVTKKSGKYEFGSGLAAQIDPRLFVPVVLSE